MLCTTLRALAPEEDFNWYREDLTKKLGKTERDDEPLPFSKIVALIGLQPTLRFLPYAPEHQEYWDSYKKWLMSRVRSPADAKTNLENYNIFKLSEGLLFQATLRVSMRATEQEVRQADIDEEMVQECAFIRIVNQNPEYREVK